MESSMPESSLLLEICAGSVTSCLAAQEGGAARVEFCDNLLEGGTTPSYGAIASARDKLQIQLNVIIRPRGGDFLYSGVEFDVMERDIGACRKLGVDGVVIGLLTADGDIDTTRTRRLVELAAPLPVTFHRAFDVARDPYEALEDVIRAGCVRLLTSGQERSALEGIALISELRRIAGERLVIMPGAGVRLSNIAQLIDETGCFEFHTSGRAPFPSGMRYRNERIKMGGPGQDEYAITETSSDLVKQILAKANATFRRRSLL
jgi:copper homeostasis protein